MKPRTPSYRHHKPSGQAVVTIGGRDFYLGRYGTPESRVEYDRLIAEWLQNGRVLAAENDLTINELLVGYIRHCHGYYRRADGTPTSEAGEIRHSVRPLKELYGHTLARDFGPLKLKVCRESMIDAGLCRNECNKRPRRIVRAFIKWAMENELVPPRRLASVSSAAGLLFAAGLFFLLALPAQASFSVVASAFNLPVGTVSRIRAAVVSPFSAVFVFHFLAASRPPNKTGTVTVAHPRAAIATHNRCRTFSSSLSSKVTERHGR